MRPPSFVELALPGDANLDGMVDVNDLTIVLSNFGSTNAVWSQGDFNYDGRVDVYDVTILLSNFGSTLAALPALSAVPEPSAITLLLAAVASLLAFARQRPTA